MKILFVTGGIPSAIGQIHVLQLLKGLSSEHQVTVVAFDMREPWLADSNKELAGLARVISVPLARRSVSARAVRSVFSLVPVAVQGFRSEAMRQALAEACQHNEYDLVVFEQLVMGQYGSVVGNLPKLLFPVDAVSRFKWQRFRAVANPLKKLAFAVDLWMTKRYESRMYGRFKGVLFVSEVDAAYAVANDQVSPGKVFVLPLAPDTDYFKLGPDGPGRSPSLAFLGNMSNYINEDAILWFHRAVWPRLKRAFPELKLYIVGNSPTEKVQDLALGDSSVVVTGYLRDIRPPVWNATVFVSPLRMGTGIKNRVLQAMAMGKAIVASPFSAEGLGVEDGRELLIAGDTESFCEKVTFLLRSAEERERLSRAARRYVDRNHCLEVNASRFMEIAQRVLARKGGAVYEPELAYGSQDTPCTAR